MKPAANSHIVRFGFGGLASVGLAGCGGRQSTLAPDSHASTTIANLWWIMLVGAAIVFAVVLLLVLVAILRRRGTPSPPDRSDAPGAVRFAVVAGGVVPLLVLVGLFVLVLRTLPATSAPSGSQARLTIHVAGRQWYWKVRYDGTNAVTANEIHIPTGENVRVVATTDDVIHSLWVPRLNRKIDMIPGQENSVLFRADRPGTMRGQCAEFCGLQHAKMGLLVVAQPPAQFQAWLRNMASPARRPTTASARAGANAFETLGCAGCHALRGTGATADIGPDLTHLATRRTLAAATIPNRRDDLGTWIVDPQHVKPGNRMPQLALTGEQVEALLDYLGGLR